MGLASAKALPRNAGYIAPLALPPPTDDDDDDGDTDDDDDDDDGDDEQAPEPPLPPWAVVTQTVAAQAAESLARNIGPAVEGVISMLMRRNAPPPPASETPAPETPAPETPAPETPAPETPATASRNPMIHLAEINAGLTSVERRFLGDMLRSRGGDQITAELLARTVDEAIPFVKMIVARLRAEAANAQAPTVSAEPVKANAGAPPDRTETTATHASAPDFNTHVLAVALLLRADERAAVQEILRRLPPQQMEPLQQRLLAMTPDDAAAWIREHLPELGAEAAL